MSISAPPKPIQILLGRLAKYLQRAFPKVLSASSSEQPANYDEDEPEFEIVFAYRRGNSTEDQQIALFIGGSEGAGLLNDFRYEAQLHAAFNRLVDSCVRQNVDTTEATLGNICNILEGRAFFASRSYPAANQLAIAAGTFTEDEVLSPEAYFNYQWVSTTIYVSPALNDEDAEDKDYPLPEPLCKPKRWAPQRIPFLRKEADLASLEEALRDELPKRPEREVCDCSRACHKEAPEDSWDVRKAQAQFPAPKGAKALSDKKRKHR